MQPPVLAVIAIAVVVGLVALCVAITPGPGGAARSDSPSGLATPQAGEAVALASERPEELSLGYSVAIASYRTLDEALAGQRELAGLEETLYVSPTDVRGTVYYRLLCGLLPDREQAEALMSRLVESGVKDAAREWDVRPSGLAFHIGTYDSRTAADGVVGRLLRQGIPAYRIAVTSAAENAAYHVYAGGYQSREEARHLQGQISRAGLGAELVERRGSAR
jgi:cell division septation protein DedD